MGVRSIEIDANGGREGMKYILEIDFETERHCLLCPLRNEETDDCKMQYSGEFTSWEEQMKYCPLKLVEGKEVE